MSKKAQIAVAVVAGLAFLMALPATIQMVKDKYAAWKAAQPANTPAA